MAGGDGHGPDDLTHSARFRANPGAYHLFLALRVLEAEFAEAPRLGTSTRPRQDRVRLGQEATLAFPRTTISGYRPPEGARPGQLTNLVFGLFGPHGPLPPHMTEYARERQRSFRDRTLVAFADMLTHRSMSLFYRAWRTGQPAASFDRGENDALERKVAALAGHLGAMFRDRDAMPDLAKRHFAGHLGRGPKNAGGLTSILAAFFAAPVKVQEFVGSWLELEPEDRWRMGAAIGLGHGTIAGSRVWSRDAKFRIRIGPLSRAEYERLLPGGAPLSRLTAIVRNYVGDRLDWDVNLVLRAGEVPRAALGRDTRLGQTSWIGGRPDGGDADDLFLAPMRDVQTGAAAPMGS